MQLTTLPAAKSNKHNDQVFLQIGANNRQRVIRNNLYLTTLLNSITILLFIFSMAYYRWVKVQFIIGNKIQYIWVNLLYVEYEGYLSYNKAHYQICKQENNQNICSSLLEQLSFVGIFCFIVFLGAYILQLVDVIIFLWNIYHKQSLSESNLFRQVFIICAFLYSLSVYFFSLAILNNVSNSQFGVCIYLMIVSVSLLVAVVIYEQISRSKMVQAELVKQLLEQQQQFSQQQIDRYNMNKQEDSFVL